MLRIMERESGNPGVGTRANEEPKARRSLEPKVRGQLGPHSKATSLKGVAVGLLLLLLFRFVYFLTFLFFLFKILKRVVGG